MDCIKTFCDRCGKEITDNDWKIQFKRDVRVSEQVTFSSLMRQLEKSPCKTYDLCDVCSKELDAFMKNNKK